MAKRWYGVEQPLAWPVARKPRLNHSRFPIPHSRLQRGFTLVEILVVVAIVGILALALTLSIAGSSERRLEAAAERFSALVGHACEQAELRGREIGVAVGADGYAFLRLDGDRWQAVATEGELRARSWPQGLRIDLARDGREIELAPATGDAAPQLVCFSSGELTPFALELALGDSAAHYRIEGVDDGRLSTTRLEVPP